MLLLLLLLVSLAGLLDTLSLPMLPSKSCIDAVLDRFNCGVAALMMLMMVVVLVKVVKKIAFSKSNLCSFSNVAACALIDGSFIL